MADWTGHNNRFFGEHLRKQVKSKLQPKFMTVLMRVAGRIKETIDAGGAGIPVYTGNLHDATGVGVYEDGSCMYYVPTKIAKRPQSSGFNHRNVYGIVGSDYLKAAIGNAAEFSAGLWIVVFSAVPYAFYIEERDGFFQKATDELVSLVTAGLRPLAEN